MAWGSRQAGRQLREPIDRLARPGVEAQPGDRAELNVWAAKAPLAPRLTERTGLVWVSDRPVEAIFAAIGARCGRSASRAACRAHPGMLRSRLRARVRRQLTSRAAPLVLGSGLWQSRPHEDVSTATKGTG